jgi:hypothetical protein
MWNSINNIDYKYNSINFVCEYVHPETNDSTQILINMLPFNMKWLNTNVNQNMQMTEWIRIQHP